MIDRRRNEADSTDSSADAAYSAASRRGRMALCRIFPLALVFFLAGGGCRPRPATPPFTGEPYLLVWAGDADRRDSDFLAVIDADPTSPAYGAVVHTVPVGSAGNEPHAMESVLAPDGRVFAGGLLTSRTFVFAIGEPSKATLLHVDTPGADRRYATPWAYLPLPSGHRIAAFGDRQGYRGGALELLYQPGGLVELDAGGRFVRELDAGDPGAVGMIVSPCALALSTSRDRLLTADCGHGGTPTAIDWVPGVSVQVRAAASGKILQTIPLGIGTAGDENFGPHTAHLLDDGRAALVATADGGGLFASWSIATGAPSFSLVHEFGVGSEPGGAALTRNERYVLQALTGANRLVVLDVSAVRRPRVVAELRFDRDPAPPYGARAGRPHGVALSIDGTRLAVSDYTIDVPAKRRDGDRRVYVVRVDPDGGHVDFDLAFRDEVSGTVGVDFNRAAWPHGATGPARPAALLFAVRRPPPKENKR